MRYCDPGRCVLLFSLLPGLTVLAIESAPLSHKCRIQGLPLFADESGRKEWRGGRFSLWLLIIWILNYSSSKQLDSAVCGSGCIFLLIWPGARPHKHSEKPTLMYMFWEILWIEGRLPFPKRTPWQRPRYFRGIWSREHIGWIRNPENTSMYFFLAL